MTNMQPIPQVPGENDDSNIGGGAPNPLGDDTTDVDGALDPDIDEDRVDSAAADRQAATEGSLPSDTDR